MKIRNVLVLAAAVVMPLMAATPAGAAVDPSAACKDGGYVNYKDPTTGQPFKNQGRCVSSVNSGGALVPVQEEPPVGKPRVSVAPGPATEYYASLDYTFHNLPPVPEGTVPGVYMLGLWSVSTPGWGTSIDPEGTKRLYFECNNPSTIPYRVEVGYGDNATGEFVFVATVDPDEIAAAAAEACALPEMPLESSFTFNTVDNSELCSFDFQLTGLQPGVYPFVVTTTEGGRPLTFERETRVDADRLFRTGFFTDDGTEVSVTIAGGTYTATTDCR